jgi:CDP-glycerol glycerophosphotransferase
MNEHLRGLSGLARRIAHRLPAPIQSRLRQLARRVRKLASSGSAAPGPVLSVVVVASNAESYLLECLRSLQSQSLFRLEVIVVDNGSTDGTATVANQVAAQDQRVRVLLQSPASLNAARNAGAMVARGRFLAFMDATDTVPPAAYASLINSLRHTGSDFAAGSVRTVVRGQRRRPGWTNVTHDLDRPGQTLGDFPLAILDAGVTNRVFRRDFFNVDVGGFPDSANAELVAIVTATLRAKQFDFLQTVSCVRRTRLAPGKLLPDPLTLSELDSRLNWLWETWRLLGDFADPTIAAYWLGGLIDGDLGELAANAHRADASYRERLQRAAQECLSRADETAWRQVRVDRKLRLWLVANRHWTDLEQLLQYGALYGSIPETEVREGRVYAVRGELPGSAAAPHECRELSESQTALSACVEHIAWDDERLEVHGWAFIRGLDLTSDVPQLTASLIEPVTGLAHPCDVVQLHKVVANDWSLFRYQDVAAGGFIVRVDTRAVEHHPGRWQLRLTVEARDLQRTGPILAVAPGGSGHLMWGRNFRGPDDTTRVVPKLDPRLGFALHVRPEQVRARTLTTDGAGKARGAIALINPELGSLVRVTATSPLGRIAADLTKVGSDGLQRFELDLPVGAARGAVWVFRAVDLNGHQHRVSWPREADHDLQIGGGLRDACWQRSITGYCNLMTDWAVAEAANVTVTEDELRLDLRLIGLRASDCGGARLSARLAEVPVRRVETSGDGVRLVFPMLASRWGGPELPLPSDDYRVELDSGLRLLCSDTLVVRLPHDGLTGHHYYRLARDSWNRLVISLAAPLGDEERSRLAKVRLATWYQRSSFTPTESVLFQSYRGEFATDSQLAIHDELRVRRPELELLWGVTDWSVAVPEGGRALLIESREWYAALGSSRYLCHNIELDRYFRKRPYQRCLQTFHGYPFKSMGVSLWRVQERPESVIDAECARRSQAWDAIVVPESFCVDLYQREYRFTGNVLVTGYPRNDVLVTADTASVRSRVLAELGIDGDRIVVLYAPTWRDTVATGAWSAKFVDALDLKRLTEQLGDRYAVLLRGHSYNLREGLSRITERVWDVSAYPEINDLLLAADVAVLDYSSVRFDWLITGKPVLFFVPDLEDYLSSRKVLFDFRPTAPGPMLASTAEVGEALLDLSSVVSEYAAARELFNKEFNRVHDGHATERVIDAFF